MKEYKNPEEANYDITSNLENNEKPTTNPNPYIQELVNLIGILEDITDQDLLNEYGINLNEYLNPTKETLEKVKEKLQETKSGMQR